MHRCNDLHAVYNLHYVQLYQPKRRDQTVFMPEVRLFKSNKNIYKVNAFVFHEAL